MYHHSTTHFCILYIQRTSTGVFAVVVDTGGVACVVRKGPVLRSQSWELIAVHRSEENSDA